MEKYDEKEKMVREFEFYNEDLGVHLNVVIARYKKYTKVIVTEKETGAKNTFKFDHIDELIKNLINSEIRNFVLTEKIDDAIDSLL